MCVCVCFALSIVLPTAPSSPCSSHHLVIPSSHSNGFRYMGQSVFFRERWHVLQVILLFAAMSGLIVSLTDPRSLTLLNPLVRPVFFVSVSSRVRNAFLKLVYIIPSFIDVMVRACMP